MSDAGHAVTARPGVSWARYAPSPLFLLLVGLTLLSGWMLWTGRGQTRLWVFAFVAAGWVVSLCLHEFAHALLAFGGGDRSIAERGYLTLDPLKYTHFVYSIVLPLLFVLLGGIGLPGGAVFVDRARLRNRYFDSAVSAAGPLTNAALALALAVAISRRDDLGGPLEFWAALGFLAFLQVTAAVLNALPVPGLDGFGVIQPFLPHRVLKKVAPIAPYAVLGLFALLWIPFLNRWFFDAVTALLDLLGVDSGLAALGDALFRFWQ
jgi:Zn-dependent protease